eukprot:scaffold2541_cov20-Tisochrysis_lutea.AAC.1
MEEGLGKIFVSTSLAALLFLVQYIGLLLYQADLACLHATTCTQAELPGIVLLFNSITVIHEFPGLQRASNMCPYRQKAKGALLEVGSVATSGSLKSQLRQQR